MRRRVGHQDESGSGNPACEWLANGALLPVFVSERRLPFRTVLTPHTLAYQGNFWSYDFGLTNLPGDYFSAHGVEYYGSMNCLKGGILFADAVILPASGMCARRKRPSTDAGWRACSASTSTNFTAFRSTRI